MINIGLTGGSSSGGAIKPVHFPLYVKFGDNLAIGMSQDDSSNNAQGTLYPTNLNTTLTSQTQINTLFSTEAAQYYVLDDNQYDVNEVKLKVAEAFFTKFKKFVSLLYSSFTGVPQVLATTTATIYDIFRVEWLDATRFAMLYQDSTGTPLIKLIAGQVGSNGLITWGASVTVKTLTDATHANYACAGMALTDTDKLLVTYSNKVSTSYYLKARVVTVSTVTLTPQSEGADNTNYGTSAPYKINMVKIRGSAGAGAVLAAVPAITGAGAISKAQAISHDNANSISYGAATTDLPSGVATTVSYITMFSHATDKAIIASRIGTADFIYSNIYTISGTTVTLVGAVATNKVTSTSATTNYLPTRAHLGWINFGSNVLGMIYSQQSNTSARVACISVASDTWALLDDGSSTVSRMAVAAVTGTTAITNGDSTGLMYANQQGGSSELQTSSVVYSNGRAVVQTPLNINHDLGSNYDGGVWPSAAKTFFIESNANWNQTIKFQVGAGDTVMQILDAANTVLATITETNDGGGESKSKALNLTFGTTRLIFKIKNTSGQARIIKIGAVYAEVE